MNPGDDSMCAETMDDSYGRRGSSALKLKNGQVGRLLRTKWDANGTRKVALLETRLYTDPHRVSLISGAEPNGKCRFKALTMLVLSKTQVTEAGLKELRRALPGCIIEGHATKKKNPAGEDKPPKRAPRK